MIDDQGFYLEDLPFPTATDLQRSDVVLELPPDGMIRPKWIGTEWIEGGVPDLESLKLEKIRELSTQCNRAIIAGFDSDALGSIHHYSSEPEDQINLLGAFLLQADVIYICTDISGLKQGRLHNINQITQVFNDGATRKQLLIQEFHKLRITAEQAKTSNELTDIGWNV